MQSVNCEKIHSGRLQTIAAYKASAEQLITKRMIETQQFSWLVMYVTTVIRTSIFFYPHIRT